jgi:hypothetical protein
MKKSIQFLLLVLLNPLGAMAQLNIMGGEFEYKYLNNLSSSATQQIYTYEVKYHHYMSCAGGATPAVVDASKTIQEFISTTGTNAIVGSCGIYNGTSTTVPYINLGNVLHYTSVKTIPEKCACENGGASGYRELVFSGIVNLPYDASLAVNNRFILFLKVNGGQAATTSHQNDDYVSAGEIVLPNLSTVVVKERSSPEYHNSAPFFPEINKVFSYNMGAAFREYVGTGSNTHYGYTTTTDNLEYSITSLDGANINYSGTNVFGTPSASNYITIDQNTGVITGISNSVQTVLLGVSIVKKDVQNNIISKLLRRIQLTVLPASSNTAPVLLGINGTNSNNLEIIRGSTPNPLCFTINAIDGNMDNIILSEFGLPTQFPGATLSILNNNTPNPIATICIDPSQTATALLPTKTEYCFLVKAEDNACSKISPTSTINGTSYGEYCIHIVDRPACQTNNAQVTSTNLSLIPVRSRIVYPSQAGDGKDGSILTYCKDEQVNFNFTDTYNTQAKWTITNNSAVVVTSGSGATFSPLLNTLGTYTLNINSTIPGSTLECFITSIPFKVIDCVKHDCKDCIGSFAPEKGTYILSAWVKQVAGATVTNYTAPEIKVSLFNSLGGSAISLIPAFIPSGQIIDGWQRIEGTFEIPINANYIKLDLTTTGADVYYDDIRIHPFDGSMKSYVYDPITLRLSAELDERNYATFYEYDEEGKLVRVKKETEKGIMTIKENKNSSPKR